MARDDERERFLGWRQVRDLTGLGRTTAWRLRQAGDFPEPVPISPGRVAWRAGDIAAWIESRRPSTRYAAAKSAIGTTAIPPSQRRAITASPPSPDPPPRRNGGRPTASPRRRAGLAIAEGQLGFDF